MVFEDLDKKLNAKKINAESHKRRYWKIRNKVIHYLGGGCKVCGDFDPTHLEIHHIKPAMSHSRNGYTRIKEMQMILSGELEAELLCYRHHRNERHGGSTEIAENSARKQRTNQRTNQRSG